MVPMMIPLTRYRRSVNPKEVRKMATDIKALYEQVKEGKKNNSGIIDDCRAKTVEILVELNKSGIKELEFSVLRKMVEKLMQETRGDKYELNYSSYRYAMKSEKAKGSGIRYDETTKIIKMVGVRK
jgi:anaerobic ribonucleoside-triphosphate reductase